MDDQESEDRLEAERAAALPPRNCKICRQQINPFRLLAMPKTEICVGCSSAYGPEFEPVSSDVCTSKDGSMKKNYSGVNVTFRPRRLPCS